MRVCKEKLMIAMARACMTTGELEEKSGMKRPTLDKAIMGRSVMPATLGKIAQALGVDVTEIMEKEE